MSTAHQPDPKPLIEAVTSLPAHLEYECRAVQAIQAVALSHWGEEWDEPKARIELKRLLDQNWIRIRPSRPANNISETGKPYPPVTGYYARVPENER